MNLVKPRYRHGDVVDVDGVRVLLKVNRRARRVSVRVDASRNQVVAVARSERSLKDAVAFAADRSTWIKTRLAGRPKETPFAPGSIIPFRGKSVRLEQVTNASAARLVDDLFEPRIVSGGEGAAYARRIERLLRSEASKALSERTEAHAMALGLKVPKVSIGDASSRWGSCTPDRGAIRYSWRLILAPPDVLDYVAAHEVAHLIHADHSRKFWAVVHRLVGDERRFRKWLHSEGMALHAVGREAA
ncbi:MAG TPA: SprT family zinc-dependent metalloprotease [Caulobacteraceae bacterium]|nr:SprT family zinc-dependent metalloprotease [Caulobacteraceae bacterium]